MSVAASDDAVVVERLSKRYRPRRQTSSVPLPWLFPRRLRERLHENATGQAAEDPDDDLDDGEPPPEDLDRRAQRPGDIWALDDVSFELPAGSGLGILGSNGSGKTTLLKVIGRITPPTAGRVLIRGRVAPMLDVATSLLQREQSGRKNVRLLANLFGVPRGVVERQMDDIVDFAELVELIDVPTKRYSSGQLRRLALATVLRLEPDILLADEVLAVGDAAFRERCLDEVERRRGEGLTLLLASHDLDLLGRLCPEAIWLDAGHLVDRGPPEELAARHGAGRRRPAPARRGSLAPVPDAAVTTPRGGGKRTFNAQAALHSGAVFTPEGDPTELVSVQEGTTVSMLLEVAQPVEVRAVVTLHLDGIAHLRLFQGSPFHAARPGRYVASVAVPPGLLQEGFYVGRISAILSADGQETTIARPNAFSFECYDRRDPDERPEDPVEGLTELWDLAWSAGRHAGPWLEPAPPSRGRSA